MATLICHKDSHLDHGLTPAQLAYVFGVFSNYERAPIRGIAPPPVMVQTITLPPWLGTAPCALRGPLAGDAPITGPAEQPIAASYYEAREVAPDHVVLMKRGTRPYASRMVNMAPKQSPLVTVVAGPHDGHDFVLYTVYGGPAAPREPGDIEWSASKLTEPQTDEQIAKLKADLAQSQDFWATHALALMPPDFTWTVELSIAEKWVADGAEFTDERATDMLMRRFPYLYGNELHAKVIGTPDPDLVAVVQGYESHADKLARDADRKRVSRVNSAEDQ